MVRQVGKRAGGILSYFTRHKTAANLLLVIMLVVGLVSTTQIRSQFFPDVILDSVTVSVKWEGAGPEDVDSGVIALLEPALLAVEGIESTSSFANEGRGTIRMEFESNWDMARAADDVKVAVDSVSGLPDGIDDPVVRRGAWRDRVTDVIIHGPVSPDQLGRFSDEFVGRLFSEGVTRATIRGVSAPDIEITVSQRDMIQNDVTLSQIASVIAEEAEADPAGDVAGGSARVRTGVAKRSVETIEQIVIRSNTDGSKLRIGDVAQISQTSIDAKRSYYVGDNPAVSIRVDRADQGDAIKMQAIVQTVADEMELILPADVQIELIRTRAQAISDRLSLLLENGLYGLALVIGLLFLFLNARTAFWVALGIPVAMFAAVALMYASGLTLNMISLFGLIITLGIVVDDAIVVGEHADYRARRLGEDPVTASENAAIRMAPPVFSATITTIIAFWGLTLVGGRFGSLIADIPFTVIVVLIASLVECFIILPNHMSHSVGIRNGVKWYDYPSHYFNIGFSWFRRVMFRRFMKLILALRYPVFAGLILLLMSQATLVISGKIPFRFINLPERASISGNIAMLSGATRADTEVMVQELQRAVKATAKTFEDKHGTNPVIFAMGEVGGSSGRGLSGVENKDTDLLGSISVELIDIDSRPYSSFTFIGALQDEVRDHPLLEIISFRGFRFGPGGDALDVQFIGADSTVLKAAAEELKTQLGKFSEVSAVEDDLSYDKQELVLDLTPQGAALGFTIDSIGRELRNRLNGITAASFPVGARTSEIIVSLPSAEVGADFLETTQLRTPAGEYVPLTDIVSVQTQIGFSTVLRENGLRLMSVTGDISEDNPDRAAQIMEELNKQILPRIATDFGVEWRLSGQAEQEKEFLSDAAIGYSLCLLGIYLTLTWIFASWTRPIVVMAVIPFGMIGMIYGHHVMEVPLSMFSIVGAIGMSGIIINDSIVLVTTVDEYAENRGLVPAIIDAASDRFRPVLLTTLTTVLGLLPLLYESSAQAEFLKPTIITLSFGLGFGMFLVLLIVPALLVMQRDVGRLFKSYRRGLFNSHMRLVDRGILIAATLAGMGAFAATVGKFAITGTTSTIVNFAMQASGIGSLGVATMLVLIMLLLVIVLCVYVIFAVLNMRSDFRPAGS